MVELTGTLITGILSTIAAFHLSLPDRSPRWALLPLPALALWLAGSGWGCLRHFAAGLGTGYDLDVRDGLDCVMFIGGFGLPLMALLFWLLGRARPIAPIPVAVTAGLAAAAFGTFLQQSDDPL